MGDLNYMWCGRLWVGSRDIGATTIWSNKSMIIPFMYLESKNLLTNCQYACTYRKKFGTCDAFIDLTCNIGGDLKMTAFGEFSDLWSTIGGKPLRLLEGSEDVQGKCVCIHRLKGLDPCFPELMKDLCGSPKPYLLIGELYNPGTQVTIAILPQCLELEELGLKSCGEKEPFLYIAFIFSVCMERAQEIFVPKQSLQLLKVKNKYKIAEFVGNSTGKMSKSEVKDTPEVCDLSAGRSDVTTDMDTKRTVGEDGATTSYKEEMVYSAPTSAPEGKQCGALVKDGDICLASKKCATMNSDNRHCSNEESDRIRPSGKKEVVNRDSKKVREKTHSSSKTVTDKLESNSNGKETMLKESHKRRRKKFDRVSDMVSKKKDDLGNNRHKEKKRNCGVKSVTVSSVTEVEHPHFAESDVNDIRTNAQKLLKENDTGNSDTKMECSKAKKKQADFRIAGKIENIDHQGKVKQNLHSGKSTSHSQPDAASRLLKKSSKSSSSKWNIQNFIQRKRKPDILKACAGENVISKQLNKSLEEMPDVQSPGKGQTMPAVQSPGKGQTMPDVQSPAKRQTMPDVKSPGKEQTMPDVKSPGKRQTMPDVKSPGKMQTTPKKLRRERFKIKVTVKSSICEVKCILSPSYKLKEGKTCNKEDAGKRNVSQTHSQKDIVGQLRKKGKGIKRSISATQIMDGNCQDFGIDSSEQDQPLDSVTQKSIKVEPLDDVTQKSIKVEPLDDVTQKPFKAEPLDEVTQKPVKVEIEQENIATGKSKKILEVVGLDNEKIKCEDSSAVTNVVLQNSIASKNKSPHTKEKKKDLKTLVFSPSTGKSIASKNKSPHTKQKKNDLKTLVTSPLTGKSIASKNKSPHTKKKKKDLKTLVTSPSTGKSIASKIKTSHTKQKKNYLKTLVTSPSTGKNIASKNKSPHTKEKKNDLKTLVTSPSTGKSIASKNKSPHTKKKKNFLKTLVTSPSTGRSYDIPLKSAKLVIKNILDLPKYAKLRHMPYSTITLTDAVAERKKHRPLSPGKSSSKKKSSHKRKLKDKTHRDELSKYGYSKDASVMQTTTRDSKLPIESIELPNTLTCGNSKELPFEVCKSDDGLKSVNIDNNFQFDCIQKDPLDLSVHKNSLEATERSVSFTIKEDRDDLEKSSPLNSEQEDDMLLKDEPEDDILLKNLPLYNEGKCVLLDKFIAAMDSQTMNIEESNLPIQNDIDFTDLKASILETNHSVVAEAKGFSFVDKNSKNIPPALQENHISSSERYSPVKKEQCSEVLCDSSVQDEPVASGIEVHGNDVSLSFRSDESVLNRFELANEFGENLSSNLNFEIEHKPSASILVEAHSLNKISYNRKDIEYRAGVKYENQNMEYSAAEDIGNFRDQEHNCLYNDTCLDSLMKICVSPDDHALCSAELVKSIMPETFQRNSTHISKCVFNPTSLEVKCLVNIIENPLSINQGNNYDEVEGKLRCKLNWLVFNKLNSLSINENESQSVITKKNSSELEGRISPSCVKETSKDISLVDPSNAIFTPYKTSSNWIDIPATNMFKSENWMESNKVNLIDASQGDIEKLKLLGPRHKFSYSSIKDLAHYGGCVYVRPERLQDLIAYQYLQELCSNPDIRFGVCLSLKDILSGQGRTLLNSKWLLMLHHTSFLDNCLEKLIEAALKDGESNEMHHQVFVPKVTLMFCFYSLANSPRSTNEENEAYDVVLRNLDTLTRAINAGIGQIIDGDPWHELGPESPVSEFISCLKVTHQCLHYSHRHAAVVVGERNISLRSSTRTFYHTTTSRELLSDVAC